MKGLSVDGFWSPVVRNGYGPERNGSVNGSGLGQKQTERLKNGSGFIIKTNGYRTVGEPFVSTACFRSITVP